MWINTPEGFKGRIFGLEKHSILVSNRKKKYRIIYHLSEVTWYKQWEEKLSWMEPFTSVVIYSMIMEADLTYSVRPKSTIEGQVELLYV